MPKLKAVKTALDFFQPIRVNTRTGIPKDVLGKGLTALALKKLDQETRPKSDESDEDDSRYGNFYHSRYDLITQLQNN